jgi:hypothetical protein
MQLGKKRATKWMSYEFDDGSTMSAEIRYLPESRRQELEERFTTKDKKGKEEIDYTALRRSIVDEIFVDWSEDIKTPDGKKAECTEENKWLLAETDPTCADYYIDIARLPGTFRLGADEFKKKYVASLSTSTNGEETNQS